MSSSGSLQKMTQVSEEVSATLLDDEETYPSAETS